MPDLTATIPHQLTRAEAKKRIQGQMATVRGQHANLLSDIQESWTGDTMVFALTAMGQQVTGRVAVEDNAVHLTVALPWLLSAIAGVLKPKIEQQGRLLLARQVSDSAGEGKR